MIANLEIVITNDWLTNSHVQKWLKSLNNGQEIIDILFDVLVDNTQRARKQTLLYKITHR